MQHAFGCCFINALHSETQRLGVVLGADRGEGVLGTRLDLAADSLVALSALEVSDVALFLAFDVRHGLRPSLDE